jgi:phage terminase Nu1 subunit (DNA packaging protein)
MNQWADPISKNQLAHLLGKDRATLDRKLRGIPFEKKGRSHLYDLRTAIEAIFDTFEAQDLDDDDGPIDPRLEKAKLDRSRRRLSDLDYQQRKAQLIPVEILEANLANLFGEIKAKILGIPTKAAQVLVGASQPEIKRTLDQLCKETLRDLSQSRLNENIKRDSQKSV